MFTEQTVKWEGEKRTEDRSDRSTLALCLKQKKEKRFQIGVKKWKGEEKWKLNKWRPKN